MWKRRLLAGALVLAAAGFAAGLGHLVDLRLRGGDIHPVYSSYRADPLGTRLFHDALADLPELSVERNTLPLNRIEIDGQTVVLMLGLNDRLFELAVYEERFIRLEALLAAGARVVITVSPESRGWLDAMNVPADPDPGEAPEPGNEEEDVADDERHSLPGERWGFEVDRLPFGPGGEVGTAPPLAEPAEAAPDSVPVAWRGTLRFTAVQEPWTILYQRGGAPVVMERPYIRGSLVLAADSFFVSNEGLSKDPHTALLAALVGDRSRVVFDETAHGGIERPGIATLVRRYRLHGFAVGSFLLLGLFLWRAKARPISSDGSEPEDETGLLAGRESRAALVSLLRRSLSPDGALKACISEWRAAFGDGNPELSRSLGDMQGTSANPVAEYRRIHHVISRQKGRHVT